MKIVTALGGNALGDTPEEQKQVLKKVTVSLSKLIQAGHEVVFVHGNGPQVGMINKAFEGRMPLSESTAMSQGYIGYHLQNALQNALNEHAQARNVASVITQVCVDKDDFGFKNPEKPIGNFYSKMPVDEFQYMEDSGRGYRRVVASPKPVDILQIENIKALIDGGFVVIACGGGGIPVIKEGATYEGVEAVIDKDHVAALLADKLKVKCLIILTEVDQVSLNFGQKNQVFLSEMNTLEARAYLEEGHFGKGSMEPKVEAAINFVEGGENRQAMITSLRNVQDVMTTKNKTVIKNL